MPERRAPRPPAKPAVGPGEPDAPKPTLDRDALDARAWIDSGMPDHQVGYGPDAPKMTPKQVRQFKPASYVRVSAGKPDPTDD